MAQKPSIPKGTRDFSPSVTIRRNYIFDTIRRIYQLYGYQPIETPAMENLSTLLGKYGEEGDKLLFKVLNSGDFLKKVSDEQLHQRDATGMVTRISEKGLRYDLTVPFARYVVQHRNEITFPFKRYQVQPVWRADKPQKGRYREFYQCDADVIGSDSLLNEAELVRIIDDVFGAMGVRVVVKLNNRKILTGLAEMIGEADKIVDITVAIDKLDKIGLDKVNEELANKGLDQKAIGQLQPIIELKGSNREKLQIMKEQLNQYETGMQGIREVEQIFGYLENWEMGSEVELDLTLARGLDYYTGAIIEVKALDYEIGSICGGGRYDDLTGVFGLSGVSGVGISFGADRIYDVLENLDLFPEETKATTQVMFVNFGAKEEAYCLALLDKVRNEGINAELYPESAKMKKQMSYANNKAIPYVALIGENEMNQGKVTFKNMTTGEQKSTSFDEFTGEVKENL
ncbi:MAG: histidine--tRNA ligase [Bacteroidales bacterium]|nr:histidine--tRNA ligase [Bacteroidales bacterium]